jgi:hypothetical protein
MDDADDDDLRLTAEDDEIAEDAMKEEIALGDVAPRMADKRKANQSFELPEEALFHMDSSLFAGRSQEVRGDFV